MDRLMDMNESTFGNALNLHLSLSVLALLNMKEHPMIKPVTMRVNRRVYCTTHTNF